MQNETTYLLTAGPHDVVVDGLTQRYHVHGSGPVCLAVPGGPGVTWERLRMPAVEKFLTMVYVDPLGTGGSDQLASHPDGYTRKRYARSLVGLLDRLSLPRAFLLGHSHGALVSQYFALHHADRLSGLILYESAAATGPKYVADVFTKVAEFAHRNAGRPELPTVLAGFQAAVTATDDKEITAALRDVLPAFFARYWQREDEFRELRATVTCTYISPMDESQSPEIIDDRDALPSLAVPTLVVAGRYDVPFSLRWAQELNGLIPLSRLVVLADSGHFGHVEEPGTFATAVRDFVLSTFA